MISGLMSTSLSLGSLPRLRSMVKSRFDTATCGAARPIPCSAYVVSNMSAMSLRNSALNSVTGSPGRESTGSGYLTIFRIIGFCEYLRLCSIVPYLLDVSVKISSHFQCGIAAEFFLCQACDGERHHGLGHHAGGGDDANI